MKCNQKDCPIRGFSKRFNAYICMSGNAHKNDFDVCCKQKEEVKEYYRKKENEK